MAWHQKGDESLSDGHVYWCIYESLSLTGFQDIWSNAGLLLTHWGRVTHIYVSKITIIGSDNGLSPGRRQAIIWTNAGILLIGKKIHLQMSSVKCLPFCLGLNVLIRPLRTNFSAISTKIQMFSLNGNSNLITRDNTFQYVVYKIKYHTDDNESKFISSQSIMSTIFPSPATGFLPRPNCT